MAGHVSAMSNQDRIAEVLRRSKKNFGPDVAQVIDSLLSPMNLGDPSLPPGQGSTSPFGEVTLSTAGSATDQALVRAHELVHQFLTPRFGVLRNFRVSLRMSGYLRSSLLRYLEEAIAETVAQLRVNGTSGVLEGIRFPVSNGYMLITDLVSEGATIGTIAAETQFFTVQFVPANPRTHSRAAAYAVTP